MCRRPGWLDQVPISADAGGAGGDCLYRISLETRGFDLSRGRILRAYTAGRVSSFFISQWAMTTSGARCSAS